MKALIIALCLLLLAACSGNNLTGGTVADVDNTERNDVDLEYCAIGKTVTYANPITGLDSKYTITGFEKYEGKEMCRAVAKDDKTGNDLTVEYYFTRTPRESYMLLKGKDGTILQTDRKTGSEAVLLS